MFVGRQVKRLKKSKSFSEKLSVVERSSWTSFISVIKEFLGKPKAENYKEIVDNFVNINQTISCRMSLKLHVLHSRLDYFKENIGGYSKEKVEIFHQDVSSYMGQCDESIMGDYPLNLLLENELEYSHQSRRKTF